MTEMMLLTKSGSKPLTQLLPLVNEAGQPLRVASLRAAAVSTLLNDDELDFTLRYMDSDGDEVTIARDADVEELLGYMADENLKCVTVLVVPQGQSASSHALETPPRSVMTAMSRVSITDFNQPMPAMAMNLLLYGLRTMKVAEDFKELEDIKWELFAVLKNEEFNNAVEELCDCEEFKELADNLVVAVYREDLQAIEETIEAQFDELLVFTQRLVARRPTLKFAMGNIVLMCLIGLIRRHDLKIHDEAATVYNVVLKAMQKCSLQNDTMDVELPVHNGVFCDSCRKLPIVGVRYKSLDTPDFDLCAKCEASGEWSTHEPFIKITDPARAPKAPRALTVRPRVLWQEKDV